MSTLSRKALGFTSSQYLMAAAVSAVLLGGGFGGYLYYHANSPHQLTIKAQLAMEQGDNPHAIEYLKRALDKNPGGELGDNIHRLLGKALINSGREADARPYLEEALAKNPQDAEALDLVAESYTHPADRKLDQALKPLTDVALADIYGSVNEGLAALEKLPQTPRNQIAEAGLHRLYFVLADDQIKRAKAALEDAQLAHDDIALENAQKHVASLKDPSEQDEKALALLRSALKQDAANLKAAEFLVQYEYQDRQFKEALADYRQFKASGVDSQDLVINAANTIIADAQTQPEYKTRYAEAEKELEAYAADHAKEPRQAHILVAIGQTLVEQGKVAEALDMAQRAGKEDPGSLDAKILEINCKIRQRKTADALALATPLTNTHSSVPQVWYLVGLGNVDMGNLQVAEDAFRKAMALNPGFTPARRALLTTVVRAGNGEAATAIATQEIRDDRYYIPAWDVTASDLQKHGQSDRVRVMLTNLAADPNLPSESRPQLIQLLLNNNLPIPAQALLAKLPADDDSTLRLRSAVAGANGDLTQARDLMTKALAKDPGNVDARLDYVELLLRSHLAPDARTQLDQAAAEAAKTPPTVLNWTRLAHGYLALRLPEPALAAIKAALAAQPQNADAQALQQQASAMMEGSKPATQPDANAALAAAARPALEAFDRKDYTAALTLAREGLAKDSSNVALHHVAARSLAALGQTDAAVEEIITTARTQPDSAESFAVFVELFPTADTALKGLGYGNSLQAVNPALGDWAMGKLEEISGDMKPAFRYYRAGIESASKTSEPAAAKDLLFRSILALDARQNDAAAIRKDAATFSADPMFSVGIHFLAADLLRVMDDDAGVAEELNQLTVALTREADPQIVLGIAQRWLAINQSDRALALVEQRVKATPAPSPDLLDAYAALVQAGNPNKALEIREQLVARDSVNPQYRIGLAQAQAALGDLPAAFKTLEDARALGETGRHMAGVARLRLLISLGLLKEAAAELASTSGAAPTADDFASMLAIGQAWMQLNNFEEARKFLAAIPVYANEYPSAAASLAALDSSAGKSNDAIARLQDAMAKAPKNYANETKLAPALFQTYLRAANPAAALELAKKELTLFPVNTPPSRNWIIYAATAAREGRDYDTAVAQLDTLDAEARKASAMDMAMLELLQNKPAQSVKTAATLANAAPAFSAITFQLLNHAPNISAGGQTDALLSGGVASTVYAVLADLSPEQQKAHMGELAKNPRVIPADVDCLLTELAAGNDAPGKLRQLGLAQRLLEMGWSTTALAILDNLDKATGNPLTLSQIQRYEALSDLRRTEQANAIRDQFAARVKKGDAVPPGVRIVLASDSARQEHYEQALAFLEPLESLNRPALLTTIASFHEKLGGAGQIEQAIALHRRVRTLDPGNVLAANNLAYTLTVAHPADKAALAEAKTAIEFAIKQAPGVTAFQDTLAWVEILSGQPQEGAQRLAKALPALRLDPAVHYHMGMAYAKSGQPALARLCLQNVAFLAKDHPIAESALAAQALAGLGSGK